MNKLNKTPRTYFDSGCHEYKNYPTKDKLLDIGYAIWHGHDIFGVIINILEDYPHVSKFDIQTAIWTMLAELYHKDKSLYFQFDRNNTLEDDVNILIEDLMRVFHLPDGDRRKAYLASGPRSISFRELNDMNCWIKAMNEERQPYQMFSYGHWIMFQGDGEIIRQFNLEEGTQTCCYPSYVYPEPWYGAPTRAKVIILGNEARYDDFISHIQNIVLAHYPQMAEGVQMTVDAWLSLSPANFYEPRVSSVEYFDKLAYMDTYNSPTYRHWLTEFRRLADMLDLKPDYKFYSKLAVINANPYPGIGVEPLAAGMLPSHYFLRQLVRFITNNDHDVKFILPSETLRPVWRTILGDVYTDLVAFGRMMILDKNKHICLANKLMRPQLKELRQLLVDDK